MSNTTPFTVSEKFTGATYAKSIALEDEIVVAADEVPDEEENKVEDVADNVAEDVTEDATEFEVTNPFEDEEIP